MRSFVYLGLVAIVLYCLYIPLSGVSEAVETPRSACTTDRLYDALPLWPQVDRISAIVLDPQGEFAYVGSSSLGADEPSSVVKVRLSDFNPVKAIQLERPDTYITASLIDAARGFVYFYTGSRVVRIRLSDFTWAGSVSLGQEDGRATAAAIDIAHGLAYFGTERGTLAKVDLNTFTYVKSAMLGSDAIGSEQVRSIAIDPAGSFAYLGMSTRIRLGEKVTDIIKVRLSDMTKLEALEFQVNSPGFTSALLDASGSFAYFGTGSQPVQIVRVKLSDFTKAGALTFNDSTLVGLLSAAIDPSGDIAYFASFANRAGTVVKIRLSTFSHLGNIPFSTKEFLLWSAALNLRDDTIVLGTWTLPGRVIKVSLSDPQQIQVIALSGEKRLGPSVIDPASGFAYVATGGPPAVIVKLSLPDFSRFGSLTLATTDSPITSAVIDTTNKLAYFATTLPTRIYKVNLVNFTVQAVRDFSNGTSWLFSGVIDPAGEFAYFTGHKSAYDPGSDRILKIRLSDLTIVDELPLNEDETNRGCSAIDAAGEFAYFCIDGHQTVPSRLLKVRLSDFSRVDSLFLQAGETPLSSLLLDANGRFAYLSADTQPGRLIKVDLTSFSRFDSRTLNQGDNYVATGVIDPSRGVAVYGLFTNPGRAIRIRLSDLTYIDPSPLSVNDCCLRGALIDPARGYVFFSAGSLNNTGPEPGTMMRVSVLPLPPFTNCLFMPHINRESLQD